MSGSGSRVSPWGQFLACVHRGGHPGKLAWFQTHCGWCAWSASNSRWRDEGPARGGTGSGLSRPGSSLCACPALLCPSTPPFPSSLIALTPWGGGSFLTCHGLGGPPQVRKGRQRRHHSDDPIFAGGAHPPFDIPAHPAFPSPPRCLGPVSIATLQPEKTTDSRQKDIPAFLCHLSTLLHTCGPAAGVPGRHLPLGDPEDSPAPLHFREALDLRAVGCWEMPETESPTLERLLISVVVSTPIVAPSTTSPDTKRCRSTPSYRMSSFQIRLALITLRA